MRQTVRRRMVWAMAASAVVSCAPTVVAPSSAGAGLPAGDACGIVHDGVRFGIPLFGRSELRLLISKRLKLVLDYRPTAFC